VTALASAARDASALPVAGGCYAVSWEACGTTHTAFTDDITGVPEGCAIARDGKVIVTETIAHMEEVA
jgi:hypothetical protein